MTTTPTKGAGTSFWRLKDGVDVATITDWQADDDWLKVGKVKDLQPGEITVEDEEDDYLDDEESGWKKTSPGQKDAGETQVTVAWLPGESIQKTLISDVEGETKTYWRVKYPNGASDVYFGYINSLGKTVAINEKMQRTIKIKNCGAPKLGESLLA